MNYKLKGNYTEHILGNWGTDIPCFATSVSLQQEKMQNHTQNVEWPVWKSWTKFTSVKFGEVQLLFPFAKDFPCQSIDVGKYTPLQYLTQ